ncbi:STAS domain-containing protein [uncultured Ruminococcus sp.]|jgi:anti-sigma B factor antagonist|uniref:STAS domain-containing protein n=1 Tax=uncultured Ruminococcus sp. TaxID=165186 RepID=UPI00292D14D4|nr:STAS domain-containing protein [uncultured Ruminococcus sp.]
MTVTKKLEGTKLTAAFEGRLDTNTTPQAEQELTGSLDNVKELILDFKQLDYISSAGLRLLLMLQKKMNNQGSMTIINANDMVKEIFEVTGFSDVLTVK